MLIAANAVNRAALHTGCGFNLEDSNLRVGVKVIFNLDGEKAHNKGKLCDKMFAATFYLTYWQDCDI